MRIVLLGAPGSGKGTQAQLLVDKYKIPQVSTGDLLRAALAAGTELGKMAKAAMDAGQLVSDEIVLGIIRERLREPDAKAGFILDGFPRNIPQARALDDMLLRLGQPIDAAVLMDVDFDVLMQRLTGRRTCDNCGAAYNIYTSPPRLDGQCDRCGSPLHHRADDNEETIGNRLRVYESQTHPLVDYYRDQGKLHSVDAVGDIDAIFARLVGLLDPVSRQSKEAARRLARIQKASEKKAAADGKEKEKAGTPAVKSLASEQKKAPAKKKVAAKKAPIKKTVSVEKKAATKKAPAKKKAPKKKSVAKKATVRKKAPAKKKSAAKKAPARKKAAAKKAPVKKTVSVKKKAVAKKAPAKKKAVTKKKSVARKATAKKKASAKKKPAAKKATARKKGPARKKGGARKRR